MSLINQDVITNSRIQNHFKLILELNETNFKIESSIAYLNLNDNKSKLPVAWDHNTVNSIYSRASNYCICRVNKFKLQHSIEIEQFNFGIISTNVYNSIIKFSELMGNPLTLNKLDINKINMFIKSIICMEETKVNSLFNDTISSFDQLMLIKPFTSKHHEWTMTINWLLNRSFLSLRDKFDITNEIIICETILIFNLMICEVKKIVHELAKCEKEINVQPTLEFNLDLIICDELKMNSKISLVANFSECSELCEEISLIENRIEDSSEIVDVRLVKITDEFETNLIKLDHDGLHIKINSQTVNNRKFIDQSIDDQLTNQETIDSKDYQSLKMVSNKFFNCSLKASLNEESILMFFTRMFNDCVKFMNFVIEGNSLQSKNGIMKGIGLVNELSPLLVLGFMQSKLNNEYFMKESLPNMLEDLSDFYKINEFVKLFNYIDFENGATEFDNDLKSIVFNDLKLLEINSLENQPINEIKTKLKMYNKLTIDFASQNDEMLIKMFDQFCDELKLVKLEHEELGIVECCLICLNRLIDKINVNQNSIAYEFLKLIIKEIVKDATLNKRTPISHHWVSTLAAIETLVNQNDLVEHKDTITCQTKSILTSLLINYFIKTLDSCCISIKFELKMFDSEIKHNVDYARNLLNLDMFVEVNDQSDNNITILNNKNKLSVIYSIISFKQMLIKIHTMCSKSLIQFGNELKGRSIGNTFGEMIKSKLQKQHSIKIQEIELSSYEQELLEVEAQLGEMVQIGSEIREEAEVNSNAQQGIDQLIGTRNILQQQIVELKEILSNLKTVEDQSNEVTADGSEPSIASNSEIIQGTTGTILNSGLIVKFEGMMNNWNLIRSEFLKQIGSSIQFNMIKYQNNGIKVLMDNGRELSQKYINYLKQAFKAQLKDTKEFICKNCWITMQFIEENAQSICINTDDHNYLKNVINVYTILDGVIYFMKFDLEERMIIQFTELNEIGTELNLNLVKLFNLINCSKSIMGKVDGSMKSKTTLIDLGNAVRGRILTNRLKINAIIHDSDINQPIIKYKVPLKLIDIIVDTNGITTCRIRTKIDEELQKYEPVPCFCEEFSENEEKVKVWINVDNLTNGLRKKVKSIGHCPVNKLKSRIEAIKNHVNEEIKTINLKLKQLRNPRNNRKSFKSKFIVGQCDIECDIDELLTQINFKNNQISFYNKLLDELSSSTLNDWFKVKAFIPKNDHVLMSNDELLELLIRKFKFQPSIKDKIIECICGNDSEHKYMNSNVNNKLFMLKFYLDCIKLRKVTNFKFENLNQMIMADLNYLYPGLLDFKSTKSTDDDELAKLMLELIEDEIETLKEIGYYDISDGTISWHKVKNFVEFSIIEFKGSHFANCGLKINFKNYCLGMNVNDLVKELPSVNEIIKLNNGFLSQLSCDQFSLMLNGAMFIGPTQSGTSDLKDQLEYQEPELKSLGIETSICNEFKFNLLNNLCMLDSDYKMFKVDCIECIKIVKRMCYNNKTEIDNIGTQLLVCLNSSKECIDSQYGIGVLNCELKAFTKSKLVDWTIVNGNFKIKSDVGRLAKLNLMPNINISLCHNPMEALHRITIEMVASAVLSCNAIVSKEFTQIDSKERDLIIQNQHVIEVKTQSQFGRAMSMYHKKAKHIGEGILIVTNESLYIDTFSLKLLTEIGFTKELFQNMANILCSFHYWRKKNESIMSTFFSSNAIKYDFNALTINNSLYKCEDVFNCQLEDNPKLSMKFGNDVEEEYSMDEIRIYSIINNEFDENVNGIQLMINDFKDMTPMVKMQKKSKNKSKLNGLNSQCEFELLSKCVEAAELINEVDQQHDCLINFKLKSDDEVKTFMLSFVGEDQVINQQLINLLLILDSVNIKQFEYKTIKLKSKLPGCNFNEFWSCFENQLSLWKDVKVCTYVVRCIWYLIESIYDNKLIDVSSDKIAWLKKKKSTINRSNISYMIQSFTNVIKRNNLFKFHNSCYKLLFMFLIANENGLDESYFMIIRKLINNLPSSFNEIANIMIRFKSEMKMEFNDFELQQVVEFNDKSIKREVDIETFVDDAMTSKLIQMKSEHVELFKISPNVTSIGKTKLMPNEFEVKLDENIDQLFKYDPIQELLTINEPDQFEELNSDFF